MFLGYAVSWTLFSDAQDSLLQTSGSHQCSLLLNGVDVNAPFHSLSVWDSKLLLLEMASKFDGAKPDGLKLDELPIEICARIASFCQASTLFSFAQTCKHTRKASWDPSVIRSAIVHQGSDWPPPSTTVVSEPGWDLGKRRSLNRRLCFGGTTYDEQMLAHVAGRDIHMWCKLAIANERANMMSSGVDHDFKAGRIQNVLRWAPHIVMYHHPFVTSRWLAWHLSAVMTGEPLETERAFLYAANVMSIDKEGTELLLTMLKTEKANLAWRHEVHRPGNTAAKLYRSMGKHDSSTAAPIYLSCASYSNKMIKQVRLKANFVLKH